MTGPGTRGSLTRHAGSPEQSETTIQGAIVKALKALGFAVAVSTAGHRGKGRVRAAYGTGCPDLMVFAGSGLVLFIETKRPKRGVVSVAQTNWHAQALRMGVQVLIAKDVESAVRWAVERRGRAIR